MKRNYNPIRCMWCGEVGHNQRTCNVKKKEEATEKARLMQLQLAGVNVDEAAPAENDEPFPPPHDNVLSQMDVFPATQDSQSTFDVIKDKVKLRLLKLQVKKGKATRAVSPPPTAATTLPLSIETINGASSATTKKIASLSKFMPTPGFKRPRMKDDCR
ncbi:hypothetical protein PIB30_008671 [Stylosanthes scabra]|uniref:CCHC-type domain-containing protein n=1 Tax=Stylosanthes scabra TaxID=79078 RepID=A0ABU6T4U6_9FABA|nr:hypothetical protein [Stylosanthes scabra]